VCDNGSGSRLCNYDTNNLPRFRALHAGGNTPTSCLVSYSQHTVATSLLELFGLEVEEEGSDLPSLRVQAPLYRRGPGYRLGGRLPGCRLLRGRDLDVASPSTGSLPGAGNFIKCLFSLGPASSRHIPSTLPQILSWRRVSPTDWWRPSVASVTLVSRVC
jgi:hypothetical protein